MKKTNEYKEYGYKVIFASEYSRRVVEAILEGHISKAIAEVEGSFVHKKRKPSYILEMTKKEREESIDELFS